MCVVVVVVVMTRMVERVVPDESFNRLKYGRVGIWKMETGFTMEPLGFSLNQKTCPLKAGLLGGLTCNTCIWK